MKKKQNCIWSSNSTLLWSIKRKSNSWFFSRKKTKWLKC